MDRNMKKWHSYKLSDVVRFNPSERLLKGRSPKSADGFVATLYKGHFWF